MGLLSEYGGEPVGDELPFWYLRALGISPNEAANKMFLEDKRGNPQTIFSMTGDLEDGGGMMFPTIRYREPQKNEYKQADPYLERMLPGQAMMESFRNRDFLRFPSEQKATGFAKRFSPTIKRGGMLE